MVRLERHVLLTISALVGVFGIAGCTHNAQSGQPSNAPGAVTAPKSGTPAIDTARLDAAKKAFAKSQGQ
jgi:hypothetical protein